MAVLLIYATGSGVGRSQKRDNFKPVYMIGVHAVSRTLGSQWILVVIADLKTKTGYGSSR